MLREKLLREYRVEFEDYGRLHFDAGDDWQTHLMNMKMAESLYETAQNELAAMVSSLQDGLWIDLSRLEVVGKQLWFSKGYYEYYKKYA